jgi:hypothetical protein
VRHSQDIFFAPGGRWTNSDRHCAMLNELGQTEAFYTHWWDLIWEFSSTSLSFSADLLPALSAIAWRCGEKIGDEHVAGLWKSRIVQDLCWTTGVGPKFRRPREFQGPSWSWAGINVCVFDRVKYSGSTKEHDRFLIKLIDCQIELVSPLTKFGAVKSGTLLVRGCIKPANWMKEYPWITPDFTIAVLEPKEELQLPQITAW